MHLIKTMQQLTNLFNAIDNTHKQTTTQSNATIISNEIKEITQKYDRKKRDLIHPMLRGMK